MPETPELPEYAWEELSRMAERQARMNQIALPMNVIAIDIHSFRPIEKNRDQKYKKYVGQYCAVKTIDGKTHIGLLIGFSPIHPEFKASKADEGNILSFTMAGSTAAIFVFDLNETIFDTECRWKPIRKLKDLEDIKDADKESPLYKMIAQLIQGANDEMGEGNG